MLFRNKKKDSPRKALQFPVDKKISVSEEIAKLKKKSLHDDENVTEEGVNENDGSSNNNC